MDNKTDKYKQSKAINLMVDEAYEIYELQCDVMESWIISFVKMDNLEACKIGHIFNGDEFSACPYCGNMCNRG